MEVRRKDKKIKMPFSSVKESSVVAINCSAYSEKYIAEAGPDQKGIQLINSDIQLPLMYKYGKLIFVHYSKFLGHESVSTTEFILMLIMIL